VCDRSGALRATASADPQAQEQHNLLISLDLNEMYPAGGSASVLDTPRLLALGGRPLSRSEPAGRNTPRTELWSAPEVSDGGSDCYGRGIAQGPISRLLSTTFLPRSGSRANLR
jgi:hypothetical protein